MKKLKTLLAAGFLALGLFTLPAQTPSSGNVSLANPTPNAVLIVSSSSPPATNAAPPDLGDQVKGLAKSTFDEIKGLDLKGGVTVEALAVYHAGDYGAGVYVGTANTNGLNVGVGLVAMNEKNAGGTKDWNLYKTSVGLSYKRSLIVPWINQPVTMSVAAGPSFNAKSPDGVFDEETATVAWQKDLGKGWALRLGGGVGHYGGWNGPFYLGFAGLSRRF